LATEAIQLNIFSKPKPNKNYLTQKSYKLFG
jgi:hypothetical protein